MHKSTIGKVIKRLILAGLLFSLHGCADQLASHDETVPDNFVSAIEAGSVDDRWIKNFNDPVLDALVDEVLTANPGFTIAEVQIEQAKTFSRQAGDDLKRSVDPQGYKESGEAAAESIWGSWEADVWERVRTGIVGSKESATATTADYHFARQSLVASLANSWFLTGTAKLQNQFAEDVVALQEQGLEVADAMQIMGQRTAHDVRQARAAVASAQEAARYAKSSYKNSLRSLELLLGRNPTAEMDSAKTFTAEIPPIPAEIASEIMKRRPDLIAAEHKVAEVFNKQNEIEMLHLPRFKFSRGVGIKNINDAITGLTAGVFTPLYTGGAIEGKIDAATAKQQEAIAAYGQVALKALKEVESLLRTEDNLLKREESLKNEVDSNRVAYEQTNLEYETGQISMLDLLIVQKKWIVSKIAELDTAGKRLVNRINLHLALGGSFEEQTSTLERKL